MTEPGFHCWGAGDGGQAVGPDAAEHWLVGQLAVVWIAVHPDRRAAGSAAG
jgi:hypothetical protein